MTTSTDDPLAEFDPLGLSTDSPNDYLGEDEDEDDELGAEELLEGWGSWNPVKAAKKAAHGIERRAKKMARTVAKGAGGTAWKVFRSDAFRWGSRGLALIPGGAPLAVSLEMAQVAADQVEDGVGEARKAYRATVALAKKGDAAAARSVKLINAAVRARRAVKAIHSGHDPKAAAHGRKVKAAPKTPAPSSAVGTLSIGGKTYKVTP